MICFSQLPLVVTDADRMNVNRAKLRVGLFAAHAHSCGISFAKRLVVFGNKNNRKTRKALNGQM